MLWIHYRADFHFCHHYVATRASPFSYVLYIVWHDVFLPMYLFVNKYLVRLISSITCLNSHPFSVVTSCLNICSKTFSPLKWQSLGLNSSPKRKCISACHVLSIPDSPTSSIPRLAHLSLIINYIYIYTNSTIGPSSLLKLHQHWLFPQPPSFASVVFSRSLPFKP